jgi:hypothetical protein
LPQLQALPLFIGQFLPLSLHAGLSAANAVTQIIAAINEKSVLAYRFILIESSIATKVARARNQKTLIKARRCNDLLI